MKKQQAKPGKNTKNTLALFFLYKPGCNDKKYLFIFI